MNRLFTTMIFIVMVVASFGQGPSKNEADSLVRLLKSDTKNSDRTEIYFKLAQYHMFKPGELAADLDSARSYMDLVSDLNAKKTSADTDGFLLLLKAQLARERGRMDEGRSMVESAVAILEKGKNKYYLGRAYFSLSEYYDYNSPNESAEKIHFVELACKAYQQTNNIERQAFTLTFLADLYQLGDKDSMAIKKLDTAQALYQAIGHKELQSVYALYSTIYYGDKLFRLALKYSLMALKSAGSAGDTSMNLCQINNYTGLAYLQAKEFESAIPYFLEALRVAEKYHDGNAALALMMNIVQAYIDLKRPGEALAFIKKIPEKLHLEKNDPNYVQMPLAYLLIYTELKKYSEARPYVDSILELMKISNISPRVQGNLYYMISKYYLESGQFPSARFYVNKLDSASAISVSAGRRRQNLQLKYRLDSAVGDYGAAFSNLRAYHTLYDSLFNETSRNEVKQLEIEYQTEKQNNEIIVLGQKNDVAQTRLDRAMLVRNFIIAGIVLLFIILGLLYRQYRLKQQSNRIILQKKQQLEHLLIEKEWLVKEIHHRVKNNFHIVASLLEIQSSYLKNKEALSALKESQHRIHSMSIIHQKLYQSETLSIIHMPEYIYELVEYLRESYAIRQNIAFSLEIENIELDHASAITLGLILNEAITNAIKYAFAETEDGKISISLNHNSNSQILLNIADNGRGLPADFGSKIGASMGMELLQGLTDDLGGSLRIENKEGTHIGIIFDYKPITGHNVSFS
jgi:two-component sensor histidine kinase